MQTRITFTLKHQSFYWIRMDSCGFVSPQIRMDSYGFVSPQIRMDSYGFVSPQIRISSDSAQLNSDLFDPTGVPSNSIWM